MLSGESIFTKIDRNGKGGKCILRKEGLGEFDLVYLALMV